MQDAKRHCDSAVTKIIKPMPMITKKRTTKNKLKKVKIIWTSNNDPLARHQTRKQLKHIL
ncbi:MAG: hypothetical protein JWN76_1982 [Chitinophagaceae bacterium]|nr:hypothetical protein [Chitinophagaceae bacterium]